MARGIGRMTAYQRALDPRDAVIAELRAKVDELEGKKKKSERLFKPYVVALQRGPVERPG